MNREKALSTYQKLYEQYEIFISDLDDDLPLQDEKILTWLHDVKQYVIDLYPVKNILHSDIESDINSFGSETQERTIQKSCAVLKKAYEDYCI